MSAESPKRTRGPATKVKSVRSIRRAIALLKSLPATNLLTYGQLQALQWVIGEGKL